MATSKPRPVGRPRLGKTTSRVELKLDERDRKRWIAAADREGLTLSEWLRAAAELAIARGSTR